MTDAGKRPTRRRLLASLGATTAIGAADCLGTWSERNLTNGECPEHDPTEPATTDWCGVLGSATNTEAVATEAVPEGDLAIGWTVLVEIYVGHHVLAVASGTAYIHDIDDELLAADAETGERMWTRPLTGPEPAPAVGGGMLVVVTNAATHAFNAATGDRRWKREDLDDGIFDASPTVAGDTVYVQSGVATHALVLSTGETHQRAAAGFPSDSMPAVDGDTAYAAGNDTYVRALDTADETERWHAKMSVRIDCSVSVVGGTVPVRTGVGTVFGLGAETGEEHWRYRLEPRRAGDERQPRQPETIVADGSRVYVAADDRLVALALADETRCWDNRNYVGDYASGTVVGAETVFVRTRDDSGGAMTVLDAATGDMRQELAGDGRQRLGIEPSVVGGGVYFAGRNTAVRLS